MLTLTINWFFFNVKANASYAEVHSCVSGGGAMQAAVQDQSRITLCRPDRCGHWPSPSPRGEGFHVPFLLRGAVYAAHINFIISGHFALNCEN